SFVAASELAAGDFPSTTAAVSILNTAQGIKGRTSMIFPAPEGNSEPFSQRFSGRDVLSGGNRSSAKTILVLEDDTTARKVFYWILERTHRVVTAETGDEAIRFCQDEKNSIG